MKKYLCVIPARIGSKRLKKKKIKSFFNKPIIYYPIKIAKQSGLFRKIIVSTDSHLIKKIAEKYGCYVPFLRKKKLSNDTALPTEVLIDVIKKMQIRDEYIFLLYPCNPLLKKIYLKKALKKIIKEKADCIFISKKFGNHPLRSLVFDKKNKFLKLKWKKFEKYNSQNLGTYYHDAGMFYIYKIKTLFKNKKVFPKKTTTVSIKKYESIDINDYEDFNFAKILYKYNTVR